MQNYTPEKHKRTIYRKPDEWWVFLSVAQRFAANTLFRYGYQLAFIRTTLHGKIAVLMRENQHEIVTLDEWGHVDTSPAIKLRS
ncbi:hypothetical protein [Gayadomonas joobiniege]|uniref:hypothetical protein n=1 Tax=Gayadomonas joobiniege TaxID=1234606 RepID=UPI00037004DB|nr:hypothetical protein [Gayadomonas joobiniege]